MPSSCFAYAPLLGRKPTKKPDTDLPPSYRYTLKKKVPELLFDFPDDEQRFIDSLRKTRYPLSGGHEVDLDIDFMKQAVCEKLPNGDKVYRLKFNCDATLDRIVFKELQIPAGSAIYTIFPQKNIARRFDTQKSNFAQKQIGGEGQSLIIEYVQPRKVKSKAKIIILFLSLTYAENNLEKEAEEEQSYSCNPPIRCPLSAYDGFPMTDDLKDDIKKYHLTQPTKLLIL